MATSKVVLNGVTLIDVTNDTVASDNLLTSYTATQADGEKAVGSLVLPTFTTQSKTVTPTEARQTVSPDENVDGLSSVVVNAVSSTYVGTGVTRRTATDLSVSGLTVTVPKGYYASQVSKTVEDVVDNDPLTVSVNGVYTAPSGKGYSPVTVNVVPRVIEGTKVSFFDYDGTIVEQYTAEEFATLSTMPSNPSHYGLNAQGWNWSLADAKAQLLACPDADLNIGQMYSTISGATEIDVTLEAGKLSPYVYFAINGTATIDWGDGSSSTVTGTTTGNIKFTNHTYAVGGAYTISINVVSGTLALKGTNSTASGLLSDTNGVNHVRDYCNAITAVRVGNNTQISSYTFACCHNVRYITIPNSDTLSTMTPTCAFASCYGLQHITIPSVLTRLGTHTFTDCIKMRSVSLPYGVTAVDTRMFDECHSLSYVTIPSTVTSIGSGAFGDCHSITKLQLPNGLTSIGNQAFQNCYMLESIALPSGVTSINLTTFGGCWSIKTITWSGQMTSIASAFANCASLRSISSLAGATTLGQNMFSYCESLEELIIPESVTSIGNSAIQSCYSLKTLTIPSGVTSIANYAIRYCYNLMELHVRPVQPPALGSSALPTNTGMVIYVPQESWDAYQQDTNWAAYASYMQGE